MREVRWKFSHKRHERGTTGDSPFKGTKGVQLAIARSEARGETGKRPLRIRTQMKGKRTRRGRVAAGIARAAGCTKDTAEWNDEAVVGR